MKSKFSRKKVNFTANRIFTDRKNPTKVFTDSIATLDDDPQEIIVYYGKGGIGKSRLLLNLTDISQEIYSAYPEKRLYNIYVSFEAHEINDEIDVMLHLRNKLHGDGGLFDYALMNYWARTKISIDGIKERYPTLPISILDALDEVNSLGGGFMSIPMFIVSDPEDYIKDEDLLDQFNEETDEISDLNAYEIGERLPYYLGLTFSFAAENGDIPVFFFDSYETIDKDSVMKNWFMEFLASCETLRACLTSRDKLKWSLVDEEWDEILEQHLLKNLSDEDSHWFLKQVPIDDEEIISAIIEQSGGVPLYLDMSVDMYEDDINHDRQPDFSKLKHGEKLVDRYMRFFDEESAYAVKILSIPTCFDTEYAFYLLDRQGIHFNMEQIAELLDRSIFLPIEGEDGLWMVDNSVRAHMRDLLKKEQIASILSNMLAYIQREDATNYFKYFASILSTIKKDPDYICDLTETILARIDHYANSGYWLELDRILGDLVDVQDESLRTIAIISKMIYIRRTGNLAQEETFIQTHPLKEEILGNFYYMYCYYRIQCRHLQGYYDEALEGYRILTEKMKLIRHTIPPHIYNTIAMKYADLLFLKGEFDLSFSIAEDLLNEEINTFDKIELMRIQGHIFRFKQKYRESIVIYSTAFKLAKQKNLSAFIGKLQTNMAEGNAFIEPKEAIAWGEKAIKTNSSAENPIETGKAYAAVSIAYAILARNLDEKNPTEAEEYFTKSLKSAEQALVFARKAGYRSGEAFALVGQALAYRFGGKIEEYEATKKTLSTLLNTLNVYRYLLELI